MMPGGVGDGGPDGDPAGAPLDSGARRDVPVRRHPGLAGVPGWFSTAEPGRWAFWPAWKRAAARLAAIAVAARLDTRPLVTGAVLGWLALLTGLALAPRPKRPPLLDLRRAAKLAEQTQNRW